MIAFKANFYPFSALFLTWQDPQRHLPHTSIVSWHRFRTLLERCAAGVCPDRRTIQISAVRLSAGRSRRWMGLSKRSVESRCGYKFRITRNRNARLSLVPGHRRGPQGTASFPPPSTAQGHSLRTMRLAVRLGFARRTFVLSLQMYGLFGTTNLGRAGLMNSRWEFPRL